MRPTRLGLRLTSISVLVLVASLGCDKLGGSAGEAEQSAAKQPDPAKAEQPAKVDAPVEAPATAPATAPKQAEPGPAAPEPTKAEPAPTPVSEFDALLVRLSELADPKAAREPSVEQDNKAAWAHYKAKEYDAAAKLFARVAARDPAWKHAHNIACALAKAGKPDDARVALVESFRRGGEEAEAAAKKDGDLASVRELEWFAALSAAPTGSEPEAIDEDEVVPANCPPGVAFGDEHYCFVDVIAPFNYAEVVFDKPITLALDIPARPSDQRWKSVSGKIPWTELRAELGIQHTTETYELSSAPAIVSLHAEGPHEEAKPFFWWPDDNAPILVIPHKQKLGKLRINAVILARKTDAGWRATNLEIVTSKHEGHGGSSLLETGFGLRYDGFELFTLAQITLDGERYGYWHDPGAGQERRFIKPEPPETRHLCRIRWEGGKLVRACAETWTDLDGAESHG